MPALAGFFPRPYPPTGGLEWRQEVLQFIAVRAQNAGAELAEGYVRWLGPLPDDLSSWVRNPLNQEDLIGKSIPAKQAIIGYRVLWSIANKVIAGNDPDAPRCLPEAMKMMEGVFAKYMGSLAPKDMSYLDMVNVIEKAYPPG